MRGDGGGGSGARHPLDLRSLRGASADSGAMWVVVGLALGLIVLDLGRLSR